MPSTMVRLNQVVKQYQKERFALRNVSFELFKGEFSYVTGTNGAGKTTLLKILFAMEFPSEGQVFVNNRDITFLSKKKVNEYRQEVGFIFQDFKLLADLNVYDNIALPLEIQKMALGELDYRVRGVLSLVGLQDRAKDFPTALSGGEQQRVAIARAMVGKPALLLADEPTGNLDSQTARDIMNLFLEIQEMGTTVVIATHDENLMKEFPARTIQLKNGYIVSDKFGNA